MRNTDSTLLPILRCPHCAQRGKGELHKTDSEQLVCVDCNTFYPIFDGLPILITPQGDFLYILRDKESRNG